MSMSTIGPTSMELQSKITKLKEIPISSSTQAICSDLSTKNGDTELLIIYIRLELDFTDQMTDGLDPLQPTQHFPL